VCQAGSRETGKKSGGLLAGGLQVGLDVVEELGGALAHGLAEHVAAGEGRLLEALALARGGREAQAARARIATRADEFRAIAKSRSFALTGFGAVDVAGTGNGVRRSRRDSEIRCVPGEPGFECGPDLDHVDPREFTGGSGACSGDSGGGAIAAGDGSLVFGVLSRGKLGETCADGVFERTDVWSYLVAKTVIDAAPASGAAAPEWATSLFPPSPAADQFCRETRACGEGHECASIDGQRSWICLASCGAGRACAAGRHCESGLCVSGPAPSASPDGCAIGGTQPRSTLLVAAFGALVAAFRIRRRR
jgi:MYXO-CTERM domain-containing protein